MSDKPTKDYVRAPAPVESVSFADLKKHRDKNRGAPFYIQPRIAGATSEQAAAIASAGQAIADALRPLPGADVWDGLRLAIKHHDQGNEAAGEAIASAIGHTLADAVDNAANELAGLADKQGETADATAAVSRSIEELAEAVTGAGNAQSEAVSEFLAPAVDNLADAVRTGFALLAGAIQQRGA